MSIKVLSNEKQKQKQSPTQNRLKQKVFTQGANSAEDSMAVSNTRSHRQLGFHLSVSTYFLSAPIPKIRERAQKV